MTFFESDDFLDPKVQDQIEQVFLSPGFPWSFYDNLNTNLPPEKRDDTIPPTMIFDDTQYADYFGFGHLIFPTPDQLSPWISAPKLILETFVNKFRLRPTRVVRIKANLLTRTHLANPLPFRPHVDLPFPHTVVIYYVNDSDGDTLLLENRFPNRDNPKVARRISPKKGRAILFDGEHYHAGSLPTQYDTRVVINFNFT
jgi:hypothetical protein